MHGFRVMRTTWVLESNIFAEACFDEMLAHLKSRDYPHHVVRIIPFSHEVMGGVPAIAGPCVVYGSLGVQKLAQRERWQPGVWTNAQFSATAYASHLGDLFLNQGLVACRLSEVEATVRSLGWSEFFVKPNSDGKAFAGTLCGAGEIGAWVEQMRSSDLLEDNNVEVVIARPRELGREWRAVMVDGRAVAYSLYKRYRRVWQERSIEPEALAAAHAAAERFRPADVFVVDICETDDGMKVIEYNTFNSAGLYACDVGAIIGSISAWVERHARSA